MPELCKTGTRWNGRRCVSRKPIEQRGRELGKMMEDARARDHTGLEGYWWELPFPEIVDGLKAQAKVGVHPFTKEFFKRRFNREFSTDPIYYGDWVERIRGVELYSMDGESLAVIEEMLGEGRW